LIGGKDAPGPLGGKGIEHLPDAIALSGLDFTRLGEDLLISAYVDVHRDR
jgi:diaminohydroxyphosphoribosylaminopyrimidine deaminase/5-amino-6-(5-phosphoribosylamino)uracil reductase